MVASLYNPLAAGIPASVWAPGGFQNQAGEITLVWDEARSSSVSTISNGGLTAEGGNDPGNWTNVITNGTGETSGKFYYEFLIDNTAGFMNHWPSFGIVTNDYWIESNEFGDYPTVEIGAFQWGIRCTGELAFGDTGDPPIFTPPAVDGDIVSIAVDLDAGKLWVALNGVFVGDPVAGTGAAYTDLLTKAPYPVSATNPAFPSASLSENDGGGKLTAKFVSTSWTYTAPLGFGPWVL